jgi:hypothetical protein
MKKRSAKSASHIRTVILREWASSRAAQIDRENGVLKHVKILGLESVNNTDGLKRRYSIEAIKQAAPLYEGKAVNADHPAHAGDTRSVHDRFGWFENISVEAAGLYGDFHVVNPSTELAESLFRAAESKPDLFGFSHNSLGEGEEVNGEFVIRRITEVKSVDLVAEPATTKSLFESEQRTMKKITLRKLLEWVKPKKDKARKQLKAILEAPEDEPLDMELDAPADMPAEPAAEGGMDALTNAVATIAKEGNHDLAMKILKLIQAEAAPVVAEEEEDEEEKDKEKETPEEEDEEKDKEKDKEKMESLRHELDNLKADKTVRVLIEDAGLKFAKSEARESFIESLLPLDDKKRKALIEDRKALLQESVSNHNRPRSQAPGSGAGNAAATSRDARLQKVTDSKSLAEAIQRR